MTDTLTPAPTAVLTAPQAAAAAASAAPAVAAASREERARWLEAVADALDAAKAELVPVAVAESHLPEARLTGEVGRTTGQLRLFAAVLRDGGYLEVIIDHARPDATPPQPELRRLLVPTGPVAVYSASNFPFAFSVAGGDTASALAAGCPVVVKAHSGHPELSRRTAAAVSAALAGAGAPDGIFGLIEGTEAGRVLIQEPAITAGAFTGSLTGGRALFDLASGRPAPVPFYAELGSINPVVVTADAVSEDGAALATGLVGSFTLGAGQFCTKPGVVFVPAGAGFEQLVAASMGGATAAPLLNQRIATGFGQGLGALAEHDAVAVVAGARSAADADAPEPLVLATTAAAVVDDPEALLAECFGPVTLLVSYASADELAAALATVEGSLTGTIHAAEGEDVRDLTALLAPRVGRLLFGGWPTGVAVTWSQHHGGPWPATTSVHTSVGATAIRRFLRPLTFQDAPEAALPPELHESNPLGVPRRVDGVLEV
ncbi:aldehyde dehydrogenase (NADP(+)) [Microlunatus aurantiacus]|uniref:Aldehyde dehydrogenase (NADP(+)) n=1 Tax=Microlunatus aurantiacus TaxID=446786 RepID=A0ABP7DGP9_9ACTN